MCKVEYVSSASLESLEEEKGTVLIMEKEATVNFLMHINKSTPAQEIEIHQSGLM